MKNIRYGFFVSVYLFAVITMLSGGLFAEEVFLTQADNEKTMTLHVGDSLNISLIGNMTTGYAWDVMQPMSATLRFLGREYKPYRVGVIGSSGVFRFKFLALYKGTCVLTLGYTRAWEEKIIPEEKFSIFLIIE